ncbi:hypothetical protein ONS95_011584 [Cadophora gregata]|uniref:uncharacterized protein n=1 Tax=Cadophora gregata TaxID=51156 RepID=UPI0026DCDF71|nr:uncharacterized protein ONS95_011584 [Cadophora gregata]KAK0120178.1 hypothetical protein ONS95_011584 [Cadophora gregata]KAK0121206.1 hypothetical protein ONS96_011385 [Cadophora gregata f. sp. sojae]
MSPDKYTMLLTGANGGLGCSIVGRLLERSNLARDIYGLYTVRKPACAPHINNVLKSADKLQHRYEISSLELESLASVRKFAGNINERVENGSLPPIRALILNAGWQEQTTQSFTLDGFDMSFQVNYLSHFLLVLLLLKSMDMDTGRIVVLSSWSHDTTHPNNKLGSSANMYAPKEFEQIFSNRKNIPVDIDSLAKGRWSSKDEHPGDANAGIRRYGAAKLCEVMMFRELSRRLATDARLSGISVLAIDPAAMPSDLTRRGGIFMRMLLGKAILPTLALIASAWNPNGMFRTTWKSAGDVMLAAFDTELLGYHPNGTYLNGSEIADVGPEAKDVYKSNQLWYESLKYAQIDNGDTLLMDWQ